MKLVPMAHPVAIILYFQQVSDFEHEFSANGSPRRPQEVSDFHY
jgi:hypothetical protein